MIAVRLLADGAVVREAVFPAGSLEIGRGPECDFVIVDPSVSRRHARVVTDATGAVWIEDAGSRHGLRLGTERVERAAVPPGGTLRCRLGGVEVELALPSAEATGELAAPAGPHRPASAGKAVAIWLAGIAAWAGVEVIEPRFWSPWQQDRLTTLSWLVLGAAVGLPVLAFLLTGLLRIVGRRAGVSDALRALAVVSWGWLVLAAVDLFLSYGLSVAAHNLVVTLLRNGAMVASVAYLASVARRGPRRRLVAAWAVATALVMAGFNAAGRLAVRQAGTPQLDYDVNVPIRGRAGPASDLETYLRTVRAGFATAEGQAAEERKHAEAARP